MAEEAGSVEAGNPAEANAPSGDTSVTSTPQTTPWIDNVQNPEVRTWAESKGLHNGTFENVLGSYHNLEKLMGADKAGRTITLLGDDATPEQQNDFYTKLGRPSDAKEYGLVPAEGHDSSFADWAGGVFHEAGLTTKQSQLLAEKWGAYTTQITQDSVDTETLSRDEAVTSLKKEWGAAYDMKVAGIDVAASKLGLTGEHLTALHSAMGPVEAMKFVDSLNTKIGDHEWDGGESISPNHKTPEQARVELSELSMNKEFMDAWLEKTHPGHNAAVEKKAGLSRMASGIPG